MKVRRLLSIVVLIAVVALCLGAATASAWEVTKSSNGFVLLRTADDTSTANVTVYRHYDYKGGDSWVLNNGGNVPVNTASYNASDYIALGGVWGSIEVPLKEGYRCQLMRITQSGKADQLFACLNEPLVVNQSTPVAVYASPNADAFPVSVDGTLPVSLDSSVSLDSTVTADLGTVGPLTSAQVGSVMLLSLAALGVLIGRGLFQRRGRR